MAQEGQRNQSMAHGREINQSMAQEKTSPKPNSESMHMEGEFRLAMTQERTSPKPNPESMHMEGELRLAMTQESIHALGVRVPYLD